MSPFACSARYQGYVTRRSARNAARRLNLATVGTTSIRAGRLRQRYMFHPEDGLLLHVAGQPTPLVLHVPSRRTGYRDMYPASRLRQCYMFLPEGRLMRHVPGQPTPPVLYVPLRGRARATCTRPAGSASAACSSRRIGFCDMNLVGRLRQRYMFVPQDPPLRHVSGHRHRAATGPRMTRRQTGRDRAPRWERPHYGRSGRPFRR